MVTISNNGMISLNRGDSFSIPLFINGGSELVPLRYSLTAHPETEIYFGVMEPGQAFENALIRKKYTHKSKINEFGDLIIYLRSEDTEYLSPGKYYYQVRAKFTDEENNEHVETVIQKKQFMILDWGV